MEQWPHLHELVQCYRADWVKDENKYGHYESIGPTTFQNQIYEGPDTDIETGEYIKGIATLAIMQHIFCYLIFCHVVFVQRCILLRPDKLKMKMLLMKNYQAHPEGRLERFLL